MNRVYPLIILLLLAFGGPFAAAQTRSDTEVPDIMRPEQPNPPPKHKTRRGSSNPVYPTRLPAPQNYTPPPSQEMVTNPPTLPPPLYVPQTGAVLPNLPVISGSGRGGTETYQDRAARCAHQAGVYGSAAGDRNAYVGSCVNQ